MLIALTVVLALPGLTLVDVASGQERLEYNRDIRPILADACFACHGPDSASRKADLRLDRREAAIESKAIVAGHADQSQLIERVMSNDPEFVMPPPETKKTLTAQQKEKLAKWINAGAEYQAHWSLIAPVRPPVPPLPNAWWPDIEAQNPVDHFIYKEIANRNRVFVILIVQIVIKQVKRLQVANDVQKVVVNLLVSIWNKV